MSCNEWKEYRLDDISLNITDGKHGNCKDEENSGYYFISAKDIKEGKIDYRNARQITKADYEDVHKRTKLEVDDILITNSGTIGKMAIITDKDEVNATTFQKSVAIVKPIKNLVLPKFLYYNLIYDLKYLINLAGGSVQKNLLLKDLRSLKVNLPNFEEQEKIANILSSLDDKIELNNEMNKTLEEMAQALFKRWLVDFEFPNENGEPYKSSGGEMVESELGMIPKGWEVVELDDICTINNSNYSNKDNWNYINYLDTANITKNKIDTIQYLDFKVDKIPSRAKRKVKKNSIIYSTVRPNQLHYGIIKNPVENMIVSTGFVTIDSKFDYINTDFIYYWLTQGKNTEILQAIGETSTTAYPSIKPNDIKKMKLAISEKNTLQEISERLDKINKYIDKLKEEEKILIEVRDTLLPKLMNGEILV